jgi:Bacterial Ig domain
MPFAHPLRSALSVLVISLLVTLVLASSGASAAGPLATASSQSVAHICAKRTKRTAAMRRCMLRVRRGSSSRDITVPTVAWKAPGAGATLEHTLQGPACEASASDDRGIDRVVFKVDGTTLNTESDAPWNCVFDTSRVSDGSHTVTATAYDAAGNSSSASLSVNVSNEAGSSTPAPAPGPAPAPAPAPSPSPTPIGDLTAPTVAWQVPAAATTIKGKLQGPACEASASDDRGIDRVVFKVDGTTLNTESDAPWNCVFDTSRVSDGSHTVTATAYDAAGNSSSASRGFTVANAAAPAPAGTPEPSPTPNPPPAPAPVPTPGHLAIAIDGGHGTWSTAETSYRAQLGAAVTRHEWDTSQPVNAQDALVLKAASQVHTRIHALLGENELGDATHYREWVVGFIRRYGLGGSFWREHPELEEARYAIQTFELGNEPYFGGMTASQYADAVRPALEEVARLGLPAKMILDSRIYGTDTSWMDTLYQRIPDLNSLFYAFADHPYWYGHDPAAGTAAGPFGRIAVLRKRMNEKGASGKPIFITEYGESTAGCGGECVSEAVQAEHLREMVEAAIVKTEWKIEMVSLYQLIDRGTNSGDRELQFGLLHQDGTPKPSYSVVRQFAQEYRG